MATRIINGDEARAAIYGSLARSVRVVASTLGPSGRSVMTERGIVADGLSAARAVCDEDGVASVGARIVRDTLFDAERDLGDGTARLACILGETVRSGLRSVAAGVSPGALADAMIDLQQPLHDHLLEEACEPPAIAELARVAGADPGLASLLGGLPQGLLETGTVELRPSRRGRDGVMLQEGFTFDTQPEAVGYSDGELAGGLVFEPVNVLVLNEQLDDFAAFARILEGFVANNKSLCIVARGFGPTARATLAANRAGLGLRLVGLVPMDVGERAFGALEDLAVATGAALIGQEVGTSLAAVRPSMLGRAERLTVRSGRAVFADPAGDRAAVTDRSRFLMAEAERQRFLSLDREHLERRAARLTGGWAEIEIAGRDDAASRLRLREGRAAISALRAARTGVVPGGGMSLSRAGERLLAGGARTEAAARRAARHALDQGCRAVTRRLALNAGLPDHAVSAGRGLLAADRAFDASLGRFRPLRGWSVADPLYTTAELLRRAVSAAATILRIEVLVCT